ncbi:MAG: permease [Phycisphaerae bacterium]
MTWRRELTRLALIAGVFAACFFMPVGSPRFDSAVGEALRLARDYARGNVLYGLVPAMLLAGAISVFVNKASVMTHLGPSASKPRAYAVASVSGAVLSACSCSVLPLFAGIYRMGAGIGPAVAFLYAGPAINVLAVVLTARALGAPMGMSRAVGAVGFSIVIGLLMHLIFRRQERQRIAAVPAMPDQGPSRPLWQTGGVFVAMALGLVFLNWTESGYSGVLRCCPDGKTYTTVRGTVVSRTGNTVTVRDAAGNQTTASADLLEDFRPLSPTNEAIFRVRYILAALAAGVTAVMLAVWYRREEIKEWALASWQFAGQILPPLLIGVLASGFLLGSQGGEGIIPSGWISAAVGGNSPLANLAAAVAGALMYSATLTEVPIVQGLINSGMGRGPALAMLLAGPAVSLPSLMVLGALVGVRKTLVYVSLVVATAAACGIVFGMFYP